MTGGLQDKVLGSAAALVASLAVSACASSRPASISFAGAVPAPPRVAIASPRAPAPVDTSALPYDPAFPPVVLDGAPISECVPFARNQSGVQIWGDAVTWWAQAEGHYVRSSHPAEGSVLVTKGYNDPTRGHVSVVSAIVSDRLIRVDHANWLGGGETTLNVPVLDVSANNDWSEVRVWHVPGAHWGGRVYNAHGFIHPFRLNGSAGLVSE
jgi:hypothetical protein